jgi:hypothetical protein
MRSRHELVQSCWGRHPFTANRARHAELPCPLWWTGAASASIQHRFSITTCTSRRKWRLSTAPRTRGVSEPETRRRWPDSSYALNGGRRCLAAIRGLQRSPPELRGGTETPGRSADRFLDDSGGHMSQIRIDFNVTGGSFVFDGKGMVSIGQTPPIGLAQPSPSFGHRTRRIGAPMPNWRVQTRRSIEVRVRAIQRRSSGGVPSRGPTVPSFEKTVVDLETASDYRWSECGARGGSISHSSVRARHKSLPNAGTGAPV